MQDTQINTFTGGLDSDSDLRSVPDSRYIDATNVDTYSVENNSQRSVSPLKGTTLAFSVPSVSSQYQITRVQVNFTANYTYSFSFYDGTSLKTGSFTTTGASSADRYTSFQSLLTAQLNSLGYYAATYSASPAYDYVRFTIAKTVFTPQAFRADITWSIGSTEKETVILQEAYLDNQGLLPVASYTIEDHLFVWSETSNESVIELGIAIVSTLGVWTYTRLFRTWRWHFPIINPEAIDIRVESVSNDQWAMYITDNYNKPKVFYIQKDYSEDCLLKYTNTNWYTATSGYLIYNFADEQTNLQLINNAGIVTFSSQLQAGGNLLSGGYRYSVRFGINGTENVTEWSVLTPSVIPVFKASTDSLSGYIQIEGTKSGESTSKANIVTVQNCMPNIFNYVELAAIYYADGGSSAKIVGKYSITSDATTITHSGFETSSSAYDARLFPQTEPVIKTAKTLEIKKNRFNIANVSIGADDPALATIASSATIGQTKKSIAATGKVGIAITNEISATITNDVVFDFSLAYSSYDLIFNNETSSDIYNQYNPTTGIFTKKISNGSVTFNVQLQFVLANAGSIKFELYKNGVLFRSGDTLQILGTNIINPMNYLGGNSIDLLVNDTLQFKLKWFPANPNLSSKLVLSSNPAATFYNITASIVQSDDFPFSLVGEYQLPQNCANYVGYMLNETYAFFARFHYKNGYISSPYHVGNYQFSDLSTGSLYTDSTGASVYSYGAVIDNIDISSIKSQLNGISIWRAVCNPTVLGSGVYFNADQFSSDYFVFGEQASIPVANNNYAVLHGSSTDERRFGVFFSHDTRINKDTFTNDGFIKMYGAPIPYNNINGLISGDKYGSFAEYLGCQTTSYEYSDEQIQDAFYNDFGVYSDIVLRNQSNPVSPVKYKINSDPTNSCIGSLEGIAITLTGYVNSNHGSDNGVYMAQYIRPFVNNQYDVTSVDILPTGTYIAINQSSPNVISGTQVFGGDAYTQKNILKVRYWSQFGAGNPRSSFITYYAQNRVNTQLFYCDKNEDVAPTRNLQGWASVNKYLFPFNSIDDVAEEQFNYDTAYSASYPYTLRAYDSNVPSESNFVSRIYYSQQKPINSVQDFYRKINALDFRDLDTKNGEIVALRDVNNYMVSVQPRAVSVLPYLSDVAIGTQGGGEILVGTGGVYNQRENIISTYGSTFQTCVYVGQNNNGNSQMYWFSPAFKKYCRYGADGIRILSDEQAMRTYFLGINSVTKEYDMIQVYDPKYASQIMTFKNEASKYTLMYNEKSNNFATFITMNPLRYFLFNNLSMASYVSSVYELFTGATLSFFGSAQEFNIKFVANKGVLNDKRFLSTALSVGTGYTFTDPTVAMSVSSHTVFPHLGTLAEKRWDNFFVAFAKAAGQQPIGQFAIIEVKTPAYIELMGAVTKWRGIFRGLFK